MGCPPAADTRPGVLQQTRAVRSAGAAGAMGGAAPRPSTSTMVLCTGTRRRRMRSPPRQGRPWRAPHVFHQCVHELKFRSMAHALTSTSQLMRALHLLLMPALSTMSSTGSSAGARHGVAVRSAGGGEGGEGGDELSGSLAVGDLGGWPAEVPGRGTRATAAPSCKCTTCSGSERDRMVLPHLAGCNLCGSVRCVFPGDAHS